MKKILCLFALALVVVSCGNKNSESSYIPKDAVGVMYMNLGSLAEKSSNVDFKSLSVSKMIEQNAPQELKAFMDEYVNAENMKSTFRNDFILGFMTYERNSGSGGLIIPINDAASFANMITPMLDKIPGGAKKQENVGKGDAFTVYSSRDMAIGWNDKTALVVVGDEYVDQELINLTKLESSENINATNYFKGFFDTSKDMGMHFTSTPLSATLKPLAKTMLQVDMDVENNNLVYYGNFEEDRVYTKTQLKFNDDVKSLIGYDSWMSKEYDANLLNMIPTNAPVVMKMSIDFKGLYKHIESLQDNKLLPETMRNQLKAGMGMADTQLNGMLQMSTDDMLGIFGESMILGVTEGITVKDSIRTYNYEGPEFEVFDKKVPYFYGAYSIKDMEKFESLMGFAMMMQRPESKGKNYFKLSDDMFVLLKDNAIFVTNDEKGADEIFSNGKLAANLSDFKHKDKLANTMYIYSSAEAGKMLSEVFNSMNPYARLYGGQDLGMKDTYEIMSE
ncbi:MAG: DUF4836 family protein, partial [Bacteroidota bacterium]